MSFLRLSLHTKSAQSGAARHHAARAASQVFLVLSLSVCLMAALPAMLDANPAAAQNHAGTFSEAGDWPSIHHDSGNSDVLPGELAAPAEFELAWSALDNASVLSSPVVGDDGRVYVTATQRNFRSRPIMWLAPLAKFLDPLLASLGGGVKLSDMLSSGLLQSRLYALDAATGKVLWERAEIALAGMAGAPLLVRDGQGNLSIVVSCLGRAIAYDPDGGIRWSSPLGFAEVAISPHLYPDGKSILLGTNKGSVYLKDAASGADLLPPYRPTDLVNTNTPGIGPDGTVYLVGNHASDPEDGVAWSVKPDLATKSWETVWVFEDVDGESQTSPTVADGRVYVGDGHAGLIAIAADGGRELWRYTFTEIGGWEDYLIYASVTVTPGGLIGMDVVSSRTGAQVDSEAYADMLPGYVAILEDKDGHAEQRYLEDWKVTSGVAYSEGSGRFYFAGMEEGEGGKARQILVSLDAASRESFSQPLENPCMNNITLADGALVVPVFWGGLIGLPMVTERGCGLHCYREKKPEPVDEEPPANPYLADSPWPESHRNSYCQASSPLPGPLHASSIKLSHEVVPLDIPITTTFSSPYPDGKRVIWCSTSGVFGEVFKLDPETFTVIDRYMPALREGAPLNFSPSISGAYSVLDRDGNLFIPNAMSCGIEVYADSIPGDRGSPIAHKGGYAVPDAYLLRPGEERIVGITMTYDGMIAFVTDLATVGVIDRSLSPASARFLSLNAGADASTPEDELERVSNSIAACEKGGIYVVTDKLMYRVQWTGSELTLDPASGAWSAAYEVGSGQQGGRLGKGSGSTPTLMGTGDGDRFVVITDGQDVMRLVLMWRDEIPDGWEPIAPGKDPRIAAEAPVTFGDPEAKVSYSEQSVLVRGYGAVVVNNRLGGEAFNFLPPALQPFSMLFSNLPGIAPYGIEKFVWDPDKRELALAWSNNTISLPNAIPTMSAETGMIYCVGQRSMAWTLEAVDWETGVSRFHYVIGYSIFHNSFYAATEIGPSGAIYYGTFCGISKLH